MTTKIISVTNEKGGVAKTTTTLNLAAALTHLEKKVLVVDLDQQANLTYYLGHEPQKTKYGISDLIYFVSSDYAVNFDEFISTNDENIDYIPSSKMLSSITAVMSGVKNNQTILRNIFKNEYFSKYDFILFDCRPSLDLLVANALVSSDGFVIPTKTDKFSLDAIYSVLDTLKNIKPLNPDIEVYGILITCFEKQTNLAKEVLSLLSEQFGDKLFKTIIPKRNEAVVSALNQKSLVSAKSSELGKCYIELAKEILLKCDK